MRIEIDNKEYEVVIVKKKSTRNTYIRVNDKLEIYVTTNYFTSDKFVINLINKNIDSIRKMINKRNKENSYQSSFYYLGKKYDIIYINDRDILLGNDKVFLNPSYDVDKWYRQEALLIFQEELDKMYKIFKYDIPYPSLTIRNMKTRWGVCNVRDKKVTLNLQLIKKDLKYLDYVIIHELSHLVYANHSSLFWLVVEEHIPNYKVIRKELKNE